MASVEKALLMLRNLPRVGLNNIRDLPIGAKQREKKVTINNVYCLLNHVANLLETAIEIKLLDDA